MIKGAGKVPKYQFFPRPNKISKLLENLISSKFIEGSRGDKIIQASNAILRRRNSYGHHETLARKDIKMVTTFSLAMQELYPHRAAEQMKHISVEDADF
jgi:hypothetical protein